MLILITSDHEETVAKAFDTLATGLAFERKMDVVFIGAAPISCIANTAAKIALARKVGLTKIHIFDASVRNTDVDTSDAAELRISAKAFRTLCAQHAAVVSF